MKRARVIQQVTFSVIKVGKKSMGMQANTTSGRYTTVQQN